MLYYLLAVIAGATVSSQVAINGKLLHYLGSPILTSLISFLVGTVGLAVLYFVSAYYGLEKVPDLSALKQTSFWMWTGGLLGAFYIFTSVFVAPKIGFANLFSLIVAGQIILALVFDHFGLLTGQPHLTSSLRLLGVGLLVVGVYLIQNN